MHENYFRFDFWIGVGKCLEGTLITFDLGRKAGVRDPRILARLGLTT